MLIKYSVVIPIKNEEHNLKDLIREVEASMTPLQEGWELICIDDGSSDRSLEILKEMQTTYSQLKVLSFTRNFGQSSAFDAGFKSALGDILITLDGDRQNDPQDIPKLLQKLPDADMVCGWRQKRKDTWIKRCISKPANIVRSKICCDQIHDTGCSLKVFKKSSLQKVKIFHGMHRFLPALFTLEGMKIAEVKVSHRARTEGRSKYHLFNRNIGPIIDMLAVYWMRKRYLRYTFKEDL